MSESPAKYFKRYRETIGFTNQNIAKKFLAGKDVIPGVDFKYIDSLNKRLIEIIKKINSIADKSFKRSKIIDFSNQNIIKPYEIIKDAGLLSKLNNQGRRPEQVLFSWLRGYVIAEYFTPAFSKIFDVSLNSIVQIGDDDLKNLETFRRSPKADLEITKNNKRIRISL